MSQDRNRLPAFPTTRWSLVAQSALPAADRSMSALNDLLTQYWPALTSHLIRKGMSAHDADDCVQTFVLSRILEGKILEVANRDRGKFRGLLMTALDRHVANLRRGQHAQKRAPDNAASLVDDTNAGVVPTTGNTPDAELMNEWGKDLLSSSLVRMRHDCSTNDQDAIWSVFEARIIQPIMEGAPAVSYDVLATRLGFASASQASNALVTGKRMFSRVLREVMLERGTPAAEIDQEIRDLEMCLGGL